MSLAKYSRLAKEQDAETSKLYKKYSQQTKNVLPDIFASINAHRDSEGKLAQTATSASFIRKLLKKASPFAKDLDKFLGGAGGAALATTKDLPFGEELATLSNKELRATIDAGRKSLFKGMNSISKQLEKRLKRELVTLSMVPKSDKTAARVIHEAIEGPLSQARTLMQTSLAGVQRDINKQTFDALPSDDAAMIYMGPNDGATRDFCRALEGKVIKKSDLGEIKNGQKGASDFRRYGGGWNCRHRLMPITLSFAKEMGMEIATQADIAKANAAGKQQ